MLVRARFGKKIKGASFEFSDFSKSVATKSIPAKPYHITTHVIIMPTAAEIKQVLEKAREDRIKAEAAALLEEERLTAEMVAAEEAEKAKKEAEKKKREEDAARAQALIEKRRREAEAAALKRANGRDGGRGRLGGEVGSGKDRQREGDGGGIPGVGLQVLQVEGDQVCAERVSC